MPNTTTARAEADTDASPTAAFHLERWSATSGNSRLSKASVALVGADRTWRARGTGNGGVDALFRAVDVALEPFLADGVELQTYSVQAVGTGHDTAASVAVSVRRPSEDPHAPAYPGRGVHVNVLEASVAAYVDAINRLLNHEGLDIEATARAARPRRSATRAEDSETRSGRLEPLMDLYNR